MKVRIHNVDFATNRGVAERQRDLDDEQTERLREHVRALVNESNQTKVADAIGVSPSTISSLLGRRQGGSYAMAFAVCALRGIPLSAILGDDATRRIIDLEPVNLDPKRQVQRSAVYLQADPKVQRAFDRDDKYTSSAAASRVTVEMYTRRLLQLIDEHRAGLLPDPDELVSGARLLPPPQDPDDD